MADRGGRTADRLRYAVIGIVTVVVLAFINVEIASKERLIDTGTTVLLRLAPKDPRSLLQGDYMALRYAMTSTVADAARRAGVTDGNIVIELDERQIARFVALHEGQPLEEDQHLLRFRKRGDAVRLASDAWFFEEGQWRVYRPARFGELRVGADGEAVLAGLRDGEHERLGEGLD